MSPRPHVAYLCSDPGIPADGSKGASVHYRRLGRALVERGARVEAFVVRSGPTELPFPVRRVAEPGSGERAVPELDALARSGRFVRALEEAGPFDAVYERLSLFGLAGWAYARRHGLPLIVEVNAPLWLEAARYRSLALPEVARASAVELMRSADAVHAVSHRLAEILRREGVPGDRIRVTPNGVSRELFERARPTRRPPFLGPGPLLVFVGSLKPWHGIEFLLGAFGRLAQRTAARLWVIGDGPLRAVVESAARRFPDRVAHTPRVPYSEIPGVLRTADLALAPYPASSPSYFCPLKLVEALAAGCPVVASDVDCVRELAGRPPVVELFQADDAESFVHTTVEALERLDALRERAAAVAVATLRDHTWERRADEILETTRSVAELRASTAP